MAILSKDDLIKKLNAHLGEDISDEALALVEDVTDTLDSLSSAEDWKTKYETNDAEWRRKYKERFMSGTNDPAVDPDPEPEPLTFENLFK